MLGDFYTSSSTVLLNGLSLLSDQVLHCNCGESSKTVLTQSVQSLGIILLQDDHDLTTVSQMVNACHIGLLPP